MKRTLLGLPAWMPWAAAAVAATGLIYAIVRSEAVQDFFDDMGNSDTFGEEEDYRSDGYEGADYGESGAGGL
ncbi:MAG: hypothetical protein Q8913_15190 [Bacteroidota bacterium]|nr:hypothetical protein [Bacteroidota bacterium]